MKKAKNGESETLTVPLSQKLGLWVASALIPPFLLIPFMMIVPRSAQLESENGFGWMLLGLFLYIPALALYMFIVNSVFLALVNVIKFSHRGAFFTFCFLPAAPFVAMVLSQTQGSLSSETLFSLIIIFTIFAASAGLLTSWLAKPKQVEGKN